MTPNVTRHEWPSKFLAIKGINFVKYDYGDKDLVAKDLGEPKPSESNFLAEF